MLCAEVAPTLPAGGPDPEVYAGDLVVRFRNPTMHHQLRQSGSDASLKITERWRPALRELRASGTDTPVLALALAAWAHSTRPGAPDRSDPATEALASCWNAGGPAAGTVSALLRTVGAADLADNTVLTAAVADRPAARTARGPRRHLTLPPHSHLSVPRTTPPPAPTRSRPRTTEFTMKESPVFEERADVVDGVALDRE
ncbi:hypothetical protein [Streptomyces sp. NPDC020571]|uniref:mannitol dehydrogenase family protein n=1 Tax=Streptomyces sp. NPDC020571 TaxID=3365079 RepID=UPI00378BC642